MNLPVALPIITLCLLISGCGGGGSDGSSSPGGVAIQPPNGAPVTTGDLNAGLTGRLISTVDFPAVRI